MIALFAVPEEIQRKLGSRRRLREDLGMLTNLIDKDDRIFWRRSAL
ncbi:hypothetical protein [Candidatus Methylomicrobium oryzae]|jgi:hypothetical protein|nr:hypothetical protein [Methylomicrobium sp. RS1]MBL1262777.1 hypothetical protein [Methylomicrobium sp. RS1]